MTTPELLWLGCPRWFVWMKGLNLSVCERHITAAERATSERDTAASRLQIRRDAFIPVRSAVSCAA